MLRLLSFVAIVLFVAAANADDLPDLVCQVVEQTTVHHVQSLPVTPSESSDMLLVKDGSLYVNPTDGDEYLYGKLQETDAFTYKTGFKILFFDGPKNENATEVHTDRYGTRIRRIRCVRS